MPCHSNPAIRETYIEEKGLLALSPFSLSNGESVVVSTLWHHTLSPHELAQFARLHFPTLSLAPYRKLSDKRFRERLSIDLLVRQRLDNEFSVAHADDGRPYLTGQGSSGTEISISHTHNTYALSLSPLAHGIDVEKWGESAWRVRTKYLSEAELLLLAAFPTFQDEARTATMLWSAKEAAFKLFAIPELVVSEIELSLDRSDHLIACLRQQPSIQAQIAFKPYPAFVRTIALRA